MQFTFLKKTSTHERIFIDSTITMNPLESSQLPSVPFGIKTKTHFSRFWACESFISLRIDSSKAIMMRHLLQPHYEARLHLTMSTLYLILLLHKNSFETTESKNMEIIQWLGILLSPIYSGFNHWLVPPLHTLMIFSQMYTSISLRTCASLLLGKTR